MDLLFIDPTPEQTAYQTQLLVDLMAIDLLDADANLHSADECRAALARRGWRPDAIMAHDSEARRIARAFFPEARLPH